MKIRGLETFENARLYFIDECQAVEELDSPAPGASQTVAARTVRYEFFLSGEAAQKYIEDIRKEYLKRNKTLKLIRTGPRARESGPWLTGQVDHHYSHNFEITHHIDCRSIPVDGLPKNLESLLKNPQRRIKSNGGHSYFL